MRKRQVALMGAAALLASLALAGCGNRGFATAWRCTSATSCTITLTSPTTNNDSMSWTVISSDRRVRIVPMSGSIVPGQQVLIHVTLPDGVCPVGLIVQAHDVALFGNSFGSSGPSVWKDAQGICHTTPP
jgi:hypothetical protein